MTYSNLQYENYLHKLGEIIAKNQWIQNHLTLKDIPNFWTILEFGEERSYGKRSAHEIRTSRMIRWLIDPNETHNLGGVFAHKLFEHIKVDYPYVGEGNKGIKATAEKEDIDIFYNDKVNQVCLAIELKQYAKEGTTSNEESQLDKYEKIVERFVENSDKAVTAYYIYLTPEKDKPSNERWRAVGYSTLIDIIDFLLEKELAQSTDRYAQDTIKIITDFKHDLQRSKDYAAKRNNDINTLFSDADKELTTALANEIEHEADTAYLDKLQEINNGKIKDLEDVILIANNYIYVQDHTPNTNIQKLTRKIYNYFAAEQTLQTEQIESYPSNKTKSRIHQEIKEKYNLSLEYVQLTGGKGQGVFFLDKDSTYRIYLSGDAKGDFPNDYIHLLPYPNPDKKRFNGRHLPNRQFNVNDISFEEGRIPFKKEDRSIAFEALITDYIIPTIKELNDQGLRPFEK